MEIPRSKGGKNALMRGRGGGRRAWARASGARREERVGTQRNERHHAEPDPVQRQVLR